ncbi:MAG: hypothetical protein OK457_01655 [Thaumarchaeota archaeon]|nr:hypothetical protein [Nitrososphaerota archaeon]
MEETLSYALYKDDPELFSIHYRDKETLKSATLENFLKSDEMAEIPLTRIVSIQRAGSEVWKKGQKSVIVKGLGSLRNRNRCF